MKLTTKLEYKFMTQTEKIKIIAEQISRDKKDIKENIKYISMWDVKDINDQFEELVVK